MAAPEVPKARRQVPPLTVRSLVFIPNGAWLDAPLTVADLGGDGYSHDSLVPAKGPAMAVEVGDQAPDFELKDQHGTPVRLSGFRGAKDVVLLWWRDGDGDLVDALVDALTPLADGGYIWLLTPKAGRSGHVEPSDIGEAAPTAGLSQTSSVSAARDWSGTRLVAPKARR